MATLFESSTPQKQPKWDAVFSSKLFSGMFTNRSALHSAADVLTEKYYSAKQDALLGGRNVELRPTLSLGRRYGLSLFSNAVYPTTVLRTYPFQLVGGGIQVIIDCGTTGSLAVFSVANASAGSTVYNGVFGSSAASNGFAGLTFLISGFQNTPNNGTFICTASSSTTLTLSNTQGIAETFAAAAISAGAVYYDQQGGGVKTLLFSKLPGAGQTGFIGVAGVLYAGDGISTWKYTPSNPNGTVWNWGIVAPTSQPGVVIIPSGSASPAWQANTIFSTMGLLVDANGNMEQLISVNSSGTNTSQFGTSGNGEPNWNQTPGGTTGPDGTITWTNRGPITAWQANTVYNNASIGGNGAGGAGNSCIIFDQATGCWINANPGLAQGTSGAIKPNFVAGVGNVVHDNSVKWFWIGNPGVPGSWQKSHTYPQIGTVTNQDAGSSIVEPIKLTIGTAMPTNQTIYWQVSGGGTSASSATAPPWATLVGTQTVDGDLIYLNLGSATWAATTNYSGWTTQGSVFSAIKDQNNNYQVCLTGGTSATVKPGTSFTLSAAANAVGGNTTYTGVFSPVIPVGAGNLSATISGFTTGANNGTFKIVSCTSTQLVVNNPSGVAESHSATVVYNAWGTTYGQQTQDGSATWVCVGAASPSWAASTIWNLPVNGFAPPSSSQPYGGSSVVDSNNEVEFVTSSGKSGSTAPSWAAIGNPTTDNGITWYNLEVFQSQSLSWTKGHVYAYSFKARALDDFYSTAVNGALPVPPGLGTALPAPTGSETNAISTASPVFTITGSNTGSVNTISGFGSTDPQVDTIVIWRDADGGGSANMFELTEIPAPKPIGGVAQPWSFRDYLPDTPTSAFPGLNELIPAPIDDVNDPPEQGFVPHVFNFTRIWGVVGTEVFFSGGPDTQVGNPNEAFNPADELPFLAPVTRLVRTAQGLVTLTSDSIEIILGGPATSSFYSTNLVPSIGLNSYNALDVMAGEIIFFGSDQQLHTISPSLNFSEVGFPIADQLANLPVSGVSDTTWNTSTAYLACHQAKTDTAVFLADGSTGWYRMNPRTVGGLNGEPTWSPYASITNGCTLVQSVETAPGVRKLLVGPTGGGKILQRDLTVFTDNGTSYDAYFTMGSLILAKPGQRAALSFFEGDFSSSVTNSTLVVKYLLNEISGSFLTMAGPPVFDPPSLYAQTLKPSSYSPLRYYFASNRSLALARHMQLTVDFGTTSTNDEVFNFTLNGKLIVER